MRPLRSRAEYERELDIEQRLSELTQRLLIDLVDPRALSSPAMMPCVDADAAMPPREKARGPLSRPDASSDREFDLTSPPVSRVSVKLKRTPAKRPASRPALSQLRKVAPALATQLDQVAKVEHRSVPLMLPMLVIPQYAGAEALLKIAFLDHASAISDTVLESLRDDALRRRLEELFGGAKPVLGHVEVFVLGLTRALAAHHEQAHRWVDELFTPSVTRFGTEELATASALSSKDLCRFVSKLRQTRNTAVHNFAEFALTEREYENWCDRAYASKSLWQWVRKGTNPLLYKTQSVGWLSFLTAALKPHGDNKN